MGRLQEGCYPSVNERGIERIRVIEGNAKGETADGGEKGLRKPPCPEKEVVIVKGKP
jgi:hypothetical protein